MTVANTTEATIVDMARNPTLELRPVALSLVINHYSDYRSDYETFVIRKNNTFFKYITPNHVGGSSGDIEIDDKWYRWTLFSESRSVGDACENDFEFLFYAYEPTKNQISKMCYRVIDYRYTGTPHATVPVIIPPKYDLEKDYTLIGNIHQYELFKKNEVKECIWRVPDGKDDFTYYECSEIQNAVEFFVLSKANTSLKYTMDKAKEVLGIDAVFVQDFSKIEAEKKAIADIRVLLNKVDPDFNELMSKVSLFSFAKMDKSVKTALMAKFTEFMGK